MVVPVTLKKNENTLINQLGIQLENLSRDEANHFDIKQGVKITSITNRELEQYGLREGQVLRRINKEVIYTIEDAENAIRNASNYGRIVLEVLTENGEIERYIFN